LVDVTPLPVAAFERAHDCVPGFLKVSGGVAAWRRVATGNIAADQTDAELKRALARAGTLLATLAAGFDLGLGVLLVFAFRHFELL
jgi:hypothetical protein